MKTTKKIKPKTHTVQICTKCGRERISPAVKKKLDAYHRLSHERNEAHEAHHRLCYANTAKPALQRALLRVVKAEQAESDGYDTLGLSEVSCDVLDGKVCKH